MPDKTQKPPAGTVNITPGSVPLVQRATWDKLWRKLLVKASKGATNDH
jgi:hypothetical protein